MNAFKTLIGFPRVEPKPPTPVVVVSEKSTFKYTNHNREVAVVEGDREVVECEAVHDAIKYTAEWRGRSWKAYLNRLDLALTYTLSKITEM